MVRGGWWVVRFAFRTRAGFEAGGLRPENVVRGAWCVLRVAFKTPGRQPAKPDLATPDESFEMHRKRVAAGS